MDELLTPLNYWHWWIVGVLLIVAEMLVPGIFLMWLGLAAVITGIVPWLAPSLAWEYQALVFAGLAGVSTLVGRQVYTRAVRDPDPTLNRRGDRYVGQIFTLDQPILNGSGRLKVGDSTWKVIGPDMVPGTRVRVVAVEGVTLRVESAALDTPSPYEPA